MQYQEAEAEPGCLNKSLRADITIDASVCANDMLAAALPATDFTRQEERLNHLCNGRAEL